MNRNGKERIREVREELIRAMRNLETLAMELDQLQEDIESGEVTFERKPELAMAG